MNNLIRGAYGLLANILGGAQGMLHPALDEPSPSHRGDRPSGLAHPADLRL